MLDKKSIFNKKENKISNIKKASWFFIKGSMTVEASVVLPIFLIFFINLSCSLEMIRLHSNLCVALWNIGNDFTVYGALTTENMRSLGTTGHISDSEDESESTNEESTEVSAQESSVGTRIIQELGDMVVSYTYIKNRIIDYLGEDYLNNSPLIDGTDSLQFYDSEIFTSNDTVAIVATYQVAPLIDLGDSLSFRMSNCYYSHLWNGYNVNGTTANDTSWIVYVTENSEVYHTSTSCTYLRLTVRVAAYSNLDNERNSEGARYYPCLFCVRDGHPAYVYLCEDGGKYHYSRNCLSLRRSYSIVSLSSVEDTHRPCSRCGGG